MPWDRTVIEGPDAIHETLKDFAARYDVTFDVRALGEDGDVAFSERTEHFVPKSGDGESFDLPVTGVFELRDGQVSAWRDYFDRRAMRS
jgi:limonene-1,2-epoxide hydrolase